MRTKLFLLAFAAALARADETGERATLSALRDMSVEELARISVTSVSKREERLFQAPAAIYVITREEIRRSTATTLPDLLRHVPGIHVARISGNKWAVSARGFSGQFANKLVVLMDGRTLYTPVYSGVYWDSVDFVLEDIERIEVIRGPGATVWGANAVNGVINIVTRSSKATKGGLLSMGGGNQARGQVSARYGTALGSRGSMRLYGKLWDHSRLESERGGEAWDAMRSGMWGFRTDWRFNDRDSLFVSGEAKHVRSEGVFGVNGLQPVLTTFQNGHASTTRGHLLARWTRQSGPDSELVVQGYQDRFEMDNPAHGEYVSTSDAEVRHSLRVHARNRVLYGINYHLTRDNLPGASVQMHPQRRSNHQIGGFVQNDFDIIPERLQLRAGVRVDHNSYTGMEVQPTLRISCQITPNQQIWGSFSRAVRSPSRMDLNLHIEAWYPIPGPLPYMEISVDGNPSYRSEHVNAFDIGYRRQVGKWLSFDIAAFANQYRRFGYMTALAPYTRMAPIPAIVTPFQYQNAAAGHGRGVEAGMQFDPLERWKVNASYSYLGLELHRTDGRADSMLNRLARTSPRHNSSLRSWLELPWKLQWDMGVTRSGATWSEVITDFGALSVPSYWLVDGAVRRPLGTGFEVQLTAENLLNHQEVRFRPLGDQPSVTGRSVVARLFWRWKGE
ncbi:MAG: TonB-dependent receptor [Acidobacteria bacterium]|nr:TonB-dependent receptor [Acidobacteriota bacterium]